MLGQNTDCHTKNVASLAVTSLLCKFARLAVFQDNVRKIAMRACC